MIYQNLSITLLLIFSFNGLSAQSINITSFKKEIEVKYSIDLDTIKLCKSYVFNGVTYDIGSVNKELLKFKKSQIILTVLADLSNSRLVHSNCNFIILLGSYSNQSNKEKRKLLKHLKDNLNKNLPKLYIRDFKCGECKAVIIDDKIYDMYEAKQILNYIQVNDILHMNYYEHPNPDYYGENAINGLVEIYLKENQK